MAALPAWLLDPANVQTAEGLLAVREPATVGRGRFAGASRVGAVIADLEGDEAVADVRVIEAG